MSSQKVSSYSSVTCQICSEKFNFLSSLVIHYVKVHHVFVCDLCGSCFDDEISLERHSHAKKIRLKVFECKYKCNYKSLFTYMYISVPHQCLKCYGVYRTQRNLRQHISAVHKNVSTSQAVNLSYVCDHCNRKFSNDYELNRHLKNCSSVEKESMFYSVPESSLGKRNESEPSQDKSITCSDLQQYDIPSVGVISLQVMSADTLLPEKVYSIPQGQLESEGHSSESIQSESLYNCLENYLDHATPGPHEEATEVDELINLALSF